MGQRTHTHHPQPAPDADPAAAAQAARLRYVRDDRPGIRRVRAGRGFRYVDPNGKPVRDAETLGRIRSLVIPPESSPFFIGEYAITPILFCPQ